MQLYPMTMRMGVQQGWRRDGDQKSALKK